MYYYILRQASSLVFLLLPFTLPYPLDQEDASTATKSFITAAHDPALEPRSQLPGDPGTCIVFVNARDISSSTTRTFAPLPKPGDPTPTPCAMDPGAPSKRTVYVGPSSITSTLILDPTPEPALQPQENLNDERRAVETTLATVIRGSAWQNKRQDEDPVATPPTTTTTSRKPTRKEPSGWLNARATLLERDDPESTPDPLTTSNTGPAVYVNARATSSGHTGRD